MLTRSMVSAASDGRGELVPLLMDVHQAEPIALSALNLAGRHRLPKVRVFLDFLIERFGSAPWRP